MPIHQTPAEYPTPFPMQQLIEKIKEAANTPSLEDIAALERELAQAIA